MNETIVVIPARLESTRLPRKLLLEVAGKPIIQYTYEAAKKAFPSVYVATDSEEISAAVWAFGGVVLMTNACATGTERVARATRWFDDELKIIINVQADEPDICPELIRDVASHACEGVIGTAASVFYSQEAHESPNNVKVLTNVHGQALYFSRLPLPPLGLWGDVTAPHLPSDLKHHIGVYAFHRSDLDKLLKCKMPTTMDRYERLEQLRWLQLGYRIMVVDALVPHVGIDTHADFVAFEQRVTKARARANLEIVPGSLAGPDDRQSWKHPGPFWGWGVK